MDTQQSCATTIHHRVQVLRQWMRSHGLSAYIFPSTDPHSGEYVPDHWKTREWITGFNGSAGTAVVTLDDAALWTDSRYWLAAEQQLVGTPFSVVRCQRNVATARELAEWLAQSLNQQGATVGMDAWTSSAASVERMRHELQRVSYSLQTDLEPATELWTDRPPLPTNVIELQPIELAGRTVSEKLADIRAALHANGADALVVSLLDEIAWTLNLRGSDVHCCPVFVSYLLILPNGAELYVDAAKLTPEVLRHLSDNNVAIRPYGPVHIDPSLTVQYDPELTNDGLVQCLTATGSDGASVPLRHVCDESPITPLKAIKNEAEIAGFRRAMLRDGVAMVQFLRWLKENVGTGLREGEEVITEMTVDRKLTALRASQPHFRGLSFDTIAGFGAHAAIVHYEATPETDIPLMPQGMLLLDSGAQYLDGTTDITRTIALGPLTEEERRDYTLVLRGFLRLCMARFPEGTTGTQLDVLARYAMWQEGKNYGHGTGHGVGAYLNVHEGPHQFRMNWMPAPLRAGMTVTVEPGIYIAGSHGARTENTMLIVADNDFHVSPHSDKRHQADGQWLRLEPLTLCPIDTVPIVPEMLLPDELSYLNIYHTRVREALLPLLDDEADRQWLIQATTEFGR